MTNERSYKAAKNEAPKSHSESRKKIIRKKKRLNINMIIMLTVIFCISVFVFLDNMNLK